MSTRFRIQDPILLFTVLALGLSGCYWLMLYVWPKGTLPSALETTGWAIFRGFGPALAAILAALCSQGLPGLRELAARLGRWKVSWRFYLLALLGSMALNVLALGSAAFFGDLELRPATIQTARMVLFFFVMALIDGPLGEEIGWRGFMLPRLMEKRGAVIASLLVGCVWFLWHIPLYAADGRQFTPEVLVLYFISVNGLSLIFTWFFLRTSGSTFFAIVLHNVYNYFIFLNRRLFPQLSETLADNRTRVVAIAILGILCAFSLAKSNPAKTRKGLR